MSTRTRDSVMYWGLTSPLECDETGAALTMATGGWAGRNMLITANC